MLFVFQLLFTFTLFITVSFFLFCVPGVFLLQKVKKSDQDTFLSISWISGISIFLLVSYFTAAIHMPWLVIFVYILLYIYLIGTGKYKGLFNTTFLQKIDWISVLIIISGTVFLSSLSIFSGFSTSTGMQFIGYVNRADGLIHIAYIKQLTYQFPPMHVGLAEVPLKGYHFLYDFLVSRFVLFFQFSAFDLYYRFFPIFILLLFGTSFYSFVYMLSKEASVRRFVLLFVYFSYSFASILEFFMKIDPTYGFGLTQVTEFIFNPSIILSVSMLLIGGYLLLVKENSYTKAIMIGIIIGLISEMKVYAGFAALSMIVGLSIYRLIFKKKERIYAIISLGIAIILTAVTFLPNNASSVGLVFHPGFMYEHLMQSSFFDPLHWQIKLQVFQEHHNILRIFLLYVEAFSLFWVLSLGVRIILVLGVVRVFKKKFWLHEGNILLLFAIVPPIIIASLFIQTLSLFDTDQFFWVAECLLAIPAGFIVGNFVKGKNLLMLGMGLILIACVWNAYYQTFVTYVLHPVQLVTITNSQINLLNKISQITPPTSTTIFIPEIDDKGELGFYDGPVIAAFTGRQSYFEKESASEYLFQNIVAKRQEQISTLHNLLVTGKAIEIAAILRNTIHTDNVITQRPYSCLDAIAASRMNAKTMYFYHIK